MNRLTAHLEKNGLKGRILSVNCLEGLQSRMCRHYDKGLFDPVFYKEALSYFSFKPPDNFSSVSSIIIIAIPRPQCKMHFTYREQTLSLTIPPTYSGFYSTIKTIEILLRKWLNPYGYSIMPARLPLKLLAVYSGLAEYGRNNITYIKGMGSFFQLTAFYSDLKCSEDCWKEVRIMQRCKKCNICEEKCPTGALDPNRFLLYGEKCIVFYNERPQEYPFPSWIDPAAHNCLIGCMLCQKFCPENSMHLGRFEKEERFSHEETGLILKATPPDKLPPSVIEKLERLDLTGCLPVLPRNLGVFFHV